MQQSTRAQDELREQVGAENLPNYESTELIHKEAIGGTPFHLIEIDQNTAFVAFGKFRITPDFKTKPATAGRWEKNENGEEYWVNGEEVEPASLQALEYVHDNVYNCILKMMAAVIQHEVRIALDAYHKTEKLAYSKEGGMERHDLKEN